MDAVLEARKMLDDLSERYDWPYTRTERVVAGLLWEVDRLSALVLAMLRSDAA